MRGRHCFKGRYFAPSDVLLHTRSRTQRVPNKTCWRSKKTGATSAFVHSPWRVSRNRTRQPLDSAKVRFKGGAAALTDALAGYVRAEGVSVVLGCVVNRISTADADAVLVEGVHVREHPRGFKCMLLICKTVPVPTCF